MLRHVLCALCLLLLTLALVPAVHAEDCPDPLLATSVDLSIDAPVAPELDPMDVPSQEILVPEIESKSLPFCRYIACALNPDLSCTCGGFYCNGHFICGIWIK